MILEPGFSSAILLSVDTINREKIKKELKDNRIKKLNNLNNC